MFFQWLAEHHLCFEREGTQGDGLFLLPLLDGKLLADLGADVQLVQLTVDPKVRGEHDISGIFEDRYLKAKMLDHRLHQSPGEKVGNNNAVRFVCVKPLPKVFRTMGVLGEKANDAGIEAGIGLGIDERLIAGKVQQESPVIFAHPVDDRGIACNKQVLHHRGMTKADEGIGKGLSRCKMSFSCVHIEQSNMHSSTIGNYRTRNKSEFALKARL